MPICYLYYSFGFGFFIMLVCNRLSNNIQNQSTKGTLIKKSIREETTQHKSRNKINLTQFFLKRKNFNKKACKTEILACSPFSLKLVILFSKCSKKYCKKCTFFLLFFLFLFFEVIVVQFQGDKEYKSSVIKCFENGRGCSVLILCK